MLDFVEDALVVQTGDGRRESFSVAGGLPVAGFDACLHKALRNLSVDVAILEKPFGSPRRPRSGTTPSMPPGTTTPYSDSDTTSTGRTPFSRSSAAGSTARRALFHFFWHGFDLAVTRFSGAAERKLELGSSHARGLLARGHLVRFWPGDDNVPDAAYYSYTAPEPEGLRQQPLAVGAWMPTGSASSLAILPYDEVRTSDDPRRTLFAFCESAYEAGARLAGWDTTAFTSSACPSPDELGELQATAAGQFGRQLARAD